MLKFSTSGLLATASLCLCTCVVDSPVFAQRPANSRVALQESFDRTELGDQWHILKGQWKLASGALTGMEQPKDQHAAVICHTAKTGNAVYEFKFMFTKNAESLEFGFNGSNGDVTNSELNFSLRITPSKWSLIKDSDVNLPPNTDQQVIAEQNKTFTKDRWYSVRITTWGPYVTAKIDNQSKLTGAAQTFANTKSAIVFRCSGANVEIDDIQIWTQL